METYEVFISEQALADLDEIYGYISSSLKEPDTAIALVEKIEQAVLSLRQMPYRNPERKTGLFANKGYRQLLVKNYLAVYRVDETKKQVIVLTVRYAKSNF